MGPAAGAPAASRPLARSHRAGSGTDAGVWRGWEPGTGVGKPRGHTSHQQGCKPGPLRETEGPGSGALTGGRRGPKQSQTQTPGCPPEARPTPRRRARRGSDAPAPGGTWALALPLARVGVLCFPRRREPLMGLPASGADTSLFCSFVPSSPGPPSLCPRLPGCPRQSRPMPLFPAPSCRQARAGEALPTGPLVTSAPGRIPTLGRGREGLGRTGRVCSRAGLGGASS